MARTYLILDSNYIAHRLRYSIQGLSHEGLSIGVVYGFFRDVLNLQNQFSTKDIIFCFDSGKSLREKAFSGYKSARRAKYQDLPEEELYELGEFRHQIKLLKTEYLPSLGFNNVLWQPGFEADDVIASVCDNNLKGKDGGIIIGADKDLYQLLSPKVSLYKLNLKSMYTERDLAKDYFGISPSQWHVVKAIAGCNTDSIPGVKGVGDITAAKFLMSIVDPKSKLYLKIKSEEEVWKRNLSLTKLPYPGCDSFDLIEDEVTSSKWRALTKRLGMESLVKRF